MLYYETGHKFYKTNQFCNRSPCGDVAHLWWCRSPVVMSLTCGDVAHPVVMKLTLWWCFCPPCGDVTHPMVMSLTLWWCNSCCGDVAHPAVMKLTLWWYFTLWWYWEVRWLTLWWYSSPCGDTERWCCLPHGDVAYPVVIARICSRRWLDTCRMVARCEVWLLNMRDCGMAERAAGGPHSRASSGSMPDEMASEMSTGW